MQHFINVILPIPIEKLFSYRITESETEFLQEGMRVAVPFGKSKIYTGIVHSFDNQPPLNYEAKEIHQILDESPIVTNLQLKHWEWISDYYVCSLGEVMRAALPSGFLLESETLIQKQKVEDFDETELKDEEFLIVEALNHQSSLTVAEIMGILDKKTVLPIIKSLLEKNLINVREEIFKKYKPKLHKYIKLNSIYQNEENLSALLDDLNRAPKQRLALMNLFQIQSQSKKPIKIDDFKSQTRISAGVIKSLIEKKILIEYLIQEDRIKFEGDESNSSINLTEIQTKALVEIQDSFKENEVVLLHGITSSGKTEIYIKLIEKAIKSEGQVLYLLPEIALTTQLVDRLQDYFGKSVIVYHSRYSSHERFEVWKNVLNNTAEAKIIIGARSAMLLPFKDLRLVVVDEEHETSFKQFDPAPRYHARDAAIVLAGLFQCKTLLGSATPSIESYFNSKEEKYGLVNLQTRFNDVLLPEIHLVDLKDKYRRKLMKGHFSDELIGEMQHALEKGEQIILFQNRRGFAPIVECNTCGHSPQCPNCDVSLTYHQYKNQLRCHYCGYNIPTPNQCHACGMVTLDTKGFGTQQIEQEASELFPKFKA
ncbi:MAG: primosomal protein N', partial [Flavobacteriaceae bacterium]|nr:primosomal protein N' [Flavobacteriaceae bacterium]